MATTTLQAFATPLATPSNLAATAKAVPLPVIGFNGAGRTGSNVAPSTIAKTAAIENIVAVKEASGNITQMAEIANLVPDGFALLSGEDAITLPLMSLGGCGVI